jgi:hypothetical protein
MVFVDMISLFNDCCLQARFDAITAEEQSRQGLVRPGLYRGIPSVIGSRHRAERKSARHSAALQGALRVLRPNNPGLKIGDKATPAMYTRAWTAILPLTKIEGPIYEYACHEGNTAIVGILAGARAQEKATQGAKKRLQNNSHSVNL